MDNQLYIKVDDQYWAIQPIPQSADSDTVTVEIRRLSDNYTWDFTDLAFENASHTGNASHISGYLWKQSFTPPTEDTYMATFRDATLDVEYYQILKAVGSTDATSFSSASEVALTNIALTRIGADRITSLSENTESARRAKALYSYVRDAVLRAHPWNFATRRDSLSQLSSTPDFDFDYEYQLPSNCLRVLKVSDGSSWITDYRIEGEKLLSDESTVYIKYTYRHTDPSKYDALFVEAFTYKLASELAYAITNNGSLAKAMFELYLEALERARAADGQESPDVEVLDEDIFINERA